MELKILIEAGAVTERSRVRTLNQDQRANLKDQLYEWTEQGVLQIVPGLHPHVLGKKKDRRTRCVTDLRQT